MRGFWALLIAVLIIAVCFTVTPQSHSEATTAPTSGPTVTLIGSVLCNRQTIAEKWNHTPTQGDHTIVMYAFDGTPEVKAEVASIMKDFWPGDTLDADQGKKLMDEFTDRTKYYLVPSDLVNSHHRDLEYPSHAMAVTGTVFEKDGKKWIDVASMDEKNIKIPFPEKMLAPDKPLVMPEKEPMMLKITDKLSLKCIKIPAGIFLCGSPLYEHPRWQDEFPHTVTLTKPYYMAETLVTQAMFEAVMGTNPSQRVPEPYKTPKDKGFYERMRHINPDVGGDFAVENITWDEVQGFCKKISEANKGLNVRIPTQAEWEWAARVGTSTPCFTEKYLEQRSFCGDKEGHCEPVKKHQPNAWGLYDMVKSGWELVSDYKQDNIREDATDPQGPTRATAANHGSGPLRRMEGGVYRGDTHLNLHGAVDENGNGEEGICMFRLVVDVDPKAADAAPDAAK